MEKTFNLTWIFLLTLTLLTAIFSNLDMRYIAIVILVLAFLKFIGVAFFFMDLNKRMYFGKYYFLGSWLCCLLECGQFESGE